MIYEVQMYNLRSISKIVDVNVIVPNRQVYYLCQFHVVPATRDEYQFDCCSRRVCYHIECAKSDRIEILQDS